MVALKHYKYNYKPEMSPKSFFEKMIKSNKEFDSLTNPNSFQNDFYNSIRSEITGLIKKLILLLKIIPLLIIYHYFI